MKNMAVTPSPLERN